MSLTLISGDNSEKFSSTVDSFERVIRSATACPVVHAKRTTFHRACFKLMDLLSFELKAPCRGKNDYFIVLFGMAVTKCLPCFFHARSKSMYLFDAWPVHYKKIARFLTKYRVDNVFFSSLHSAEYFQSLGLDCNCYFMPEGVDPAIYTVKPYNEKDIDIIYYGRQYQKLHETIESGSSSIGKKYVHSGGGKIIFNAWHDFTNGLARSKISICIPRSISHPEIAGENSTMTLRYLEAMASKCLIVGVTPEDMKGLFDYSPVVEIDLTDPVGQIAEILENYENYRPLIERNHAEIKAGHTWEHRWHDISRYLSDEVAENIPKA